MAGRFDADFGLESSGSSSRVPSSAEALALTYASQQNVSVDAVDQAVEEALRETRLDDESKAVLRNLMAGDVKSPVAQAYYHGSVGTKLGVVKTLGKPKLTVPYVLTDSEIAVLADYARDFTLAFDPRELHDHPMAAACRLVDRQLVYSRLPGAATVSDVGAAPVPLVLAGRLGKGVHACSSVLDNKDAARDVLAKKRLKKLKISSPDQAVRDSAEAWLSGSTAIVCGRRVQECEVKTDAAVSIHVYDVPIQDWARVMVKKGLSVVEGCLLFPEQVYGASVGNMTVSGARYEADFENDVFRMGFKGSPSWWYTHKLSDYLRYGVDQVLSHAGKVFSYKIVERRGDTIFFRILPVREMALPAVNPVYRLPGVKMVRVHGFPMERADKQSLWSMVRKDWLFPEPLWRDMLNVAEEMVLRGTCNHEKLYGAYRTLAPRHSINAVVVSGGYQVASLDQLMPLITHVVLFAYERVRRSQAELGAHVAAIERRRQRKDEWTIYKGLRVFANALINTAAMVVFPLVMIARGLDVATEKSLQLGTYSWRMEPEVFEVPAETLLPSSFWGDAVDEPFDGPENPPLVLAGRSGLKSEVEDMRAAVETDPELASYMLSRYESLMAEQDKQWLSGVVGSRLEPSEQIVGSSQAIVVENDSAVPPEIHTPVGRPTSSGTVDTVRRAPGPTCGVGSDELRRRKSSVLEAIQETEAEARKCEAACAANYLKTCVNGSPSTVLLMDYKELHHNPEYWWVEEGTLVRSFSGVPVKGFSHSAVFIPVSVGGSRLYPVSEEVFSLTDDDKLETVHYTVDCESYTGWAYTNDSLMIYNGPAIVTALKEALNMPMDFEIVLQQGPPGCGKTTSIVKSVSEADMVLTAVKKSAVETQGRVSSKGGPFMKFSKARVRTLDSYLVNYNRAAPLRGASCEALLADEVFMAREGRWLAAAAHLRARQLRGYGDVKQIPHIPRAECPRMHVTLLPDREETSWVTYRCPASAVACFGHVYDWKVRSASREEGSMEHIESTAGLTVPKGCVMMGMYQADKKVLEQKYGKASGIEILTVHESQGNTYEEVWLHRFDMRKRVDNYSLYDKAAYALVAMSRHTRAFKYVAPKLGDLVQGWIELGKDVQRVNAARDLSSAGFSVEKV